MSGPILNHVSLVGRLLDDACLTERPHDQLPLLVMRIESRQYGARGPAWIDATMVGERVLELDPLRAGALVAIEGELYSRIYVRPDHATGLQQQHHSLQVRAKRLTVLAGDARP